MGVSNAVGTERISTVVGYKITKGVPDGQTPNLPQRVVILAEANTANQSGLVVEEKQITSAAEAGDLYGYGSPIHQIMRILRPVNSDGIGGIPTIVIPQAEAGSAVAAARNINVSGTATKSGVHSIVVAGRNVIDGQSYDIDVVSGDTAAQIAAKIDAAINASLFSPVSAVDTSADVVLTCKWAGVTSEELSVRVDTNGDNLGITYAITSTATGSGTSDISTALALLGTEWTTILLNSYGQPKLTEIEAFNGIPDPSNPTGRYQAIDFKPFVSLWGSTEDDKDTLAGYVSSKKSQVTNALCPAPNSEGFSWEAAANGVLLYARVSQDKPHLDVQGMSYTDMPVPSDGDIGDMKDYNNRDFLVKNGISTVQLINGAYQFKDFVTTYRPDGEVPPQFRYARNLMIDFNIRFGYYLKELVNVINHSVAENNQPVSVGNVLKPKQWIQVLNNYAEELGQRNLISDVSFFQDSIVVQTSTSNPDRLETFFRYKRSPFIRIASTTGQANFIFGIN